MKPLEKFFGILLLSMMLFCIGQVISNTHSSRAEDNPYSINICATQVSSSAIHEAVESNYLPLNYEYMYEPHGYPCYLMNQGDILPPDYIHPDTLIVQKSIPCDAFIACEGDEDYWNVLDLYTVHPQYYKPK